MNSLRDVPDFGRWDRRPQKDTRWVWNEPDSGLTWCQCGKNHQLTRQIVWSLACDLDLEKCLELSYSELYELVAALWEKPYECSFLQLHLNKCIIAVHGEYARHYPIGAALDIAGYFSKTWQGCPEEQFPS